MLIRSTVNLLVVVMLLASGRLLACGWECSDELAAPAAASCHQESAPSTALNGEAAHVCLPEIVEPSVTVARSASALSMAAVPLVTVFVTRDPVTAPRYLVHSFGAPFEPPHSPAPSVLRI